MMNEEVRRIMTTKPPTVTPEDTVEYASKLLMNHRLKNLCVVDGLILVGMVTTHDLWKNIITGADTQHLKVKDVMNSAVIKIIPKDKVGTAAELFMDRRFSSLPVVNLRGELKGIVTAYDVLKYTLKKEYPHPILYGDVLEG